MKKRLTPELVASLQPAATRYEVFDTQLAGFAVRVGTNGRRVFYVHKRYIASDSTSKVHKEVLGDTEQMTLDQARERALQVIQRLQTLPKSVDIRPLAAHTVASIYDTYRSERKLSPRTAKEAAYTRNRLSELGLLELDANAVTRSQIVEKFRKFTTDSGPASANNVFGFLSAAYAYAIVRYRDDATGESQIRYNPVAALGELKLWNPKRRRQSRILPHQLSGFFKGVECELEKDYKSRGKRAEHYRRQKFRSVSYVLTSLFLGTRKTETGKLLKRNLCEVTRTLIFHDTKNGIDHHVPIGPYLWRLMSQLKQWADEEGVDYLFPSTTAQKHMKDPRGTLEQICEHAGIEVTMHDLRRTFASILERMHVPKYTLKRLMNHIYDPARDSDVTSGYIGVDTEELRPVVEEFERRVLELAGVAFEHKPA